MADCTHSLYIVISEARVRCAKGCGYNKSVGQTFREVMPGIIVEKVKVRIPEKEELLVKDVKLGYLGTIEIVLSGVPHVQVANDPALRQKFFILLKEALDVTTVCYDGAVVPIESIETDDLKGEEENAI